jgi:hypothetical protein
MRTQKESPNVTQKTTPNTTEVGFTPEGEPQIAVDGFRQVLEMLKVADTTFRESLLKRIAARDRRLAADLRRELAE